MYPPNQAYMRPQHVRPSIWRPFRRSRFWLILAAVFFFLLFKLMDFTGSRSGLPTSGGKTWTYNTPQSGGDKQKQESPPRQDDPFRGTSKAKTLCQYLKQEGIDDVFVSLKTGATEIHKKLPVHFNTTFECVKHYAVFSDMGESIEGHEILDAFADVSQASKDAYPEFELYKKLEQYRKGTLPEAEKNWKPADAPYKQGWDLDKWKFLPMLAKAYQLRPQAKWFVFMEADTGVVFSTLLTYLKTMEPSNPFYMGGQSWAGSQIFAHGGTGFVVSQEALKQLVELRSRDIAKYDQITSTDWAGDVLVSKVFAEINIRIKESWPIFQKETPESLDYTRPKLYCSPVATYHHMSAQQIQEVAQMEHEWFESKDSKKRPILHGDVLQRLVLPQMGHGTRRHWNNLFSGQEPANFDEFKEIDSFEECKKKCESVDTQCKQFFFQPGFGCKTQLSVRLGEELKASDNSMSGFLLDRVDAWMSQTMEPCQYSFNP